MILPKTLTAQLKRTPLVFIEAGANGSLPPHWQKYADLLSVIGFEPDQRSFACLQQTPRQRYFNTALYSRSGPVTLYQTKRDNVSSLYPPNHELLSNFAIAEDFAVVGTMSLAAETLDRIIQQHHLPDADFIQLDTQGSELDILHGSQELLARSVFGIEVEVEFAPMYKNQPLFADIDQFLRPLHFSLFDLRPQYFKRRRGLALGGRQGQLLHADALYLRDSAWYAAQIAAAPDAAQRRRQICAALLICLHYGYLDYAQELLTAAGSLLTTAEIRNLHKFLRTARAPEQLLPDFPGRGRIHRAVQHLAAYLRPPRQARGRLRGYLGNARIDR